MVIFSHVKMTCYFHMWRYHVFTRKLAWYFIGVYIINCVIHKFWIPIIIIHHFLCECHYSSLYRLHHRMKEKYKMNAKCTYDLSTIRKFVLIQNFIEQRNWEKLSNQKSITMTVRRGTWGFALLSRCRIFVFCGVVMNEIPSCGGVVFLILNLRYSVKRNNLQALCGVVVYHMAVVTKTEEPGLLISTTTRWT